MLSEDCGKWTSAAVAVLAGVFMMAFLSCSSGENTVEMSGETAPPVPYMEEGLPLQSGRLPDDAESLAMLGEKYFRENRFIKAIEMFERVVKLDPDNVDAYNDLGLAYHYTGRSDIAVDRLRMGAVVGPSYQRIWLSLGFVLLAEGRPDDARPALQRAVELDPDSGAGREAKSMLDGMK